MEAWQRMGKAIGAHMPLIVLFCVAAGVLFPRVFGTFEPIVPALFAFMTFQGSLNNTFRQLAETVRHPLPLIVILAITLVAMPVLAFALASLLFAGNVNIITGILLEYSVPIGIVSFMWVGMFSGNTALGLSAILVACRGALWSGVLGRPHRLSKTQRFPWRSIAARPRSTSLASAARSRSVSRLITRPKVAASSC